MNLSDNHAKMLFEESGIAENIAEARGYRTVDRKTELKRLGFSAAQCNVPGLLIPVYSPVGGIATYQHRPDLPRVGKNGRSIKYETPSGTRMTLDAHPHARPMLGDPSIPLLITEGIKKGDALVSKGLCAVTLLGVWNWRGRNEDGGLTALADWDYIALNGDRPISIVYDSDVMRKPTVYKALVRLKTFLEGR